jgi:hypothetical protein
MNNSENNNNEKNMFLDLQFVVGNNGHLFVKEMAWLKQYSIIPRLCLFHPPYPEEELNTKAKITNRYLKENVHGISWNDGYITYLDVPKIIYNLRGCTIYVVGKEKKNFLQKYLSKTTIIDLNHQGGIIRNLKDIQSYESFCEIHDDIYKEGKSEINFKCACKNCVNIYMHLIKNKLFD